MSVIKSLLFFLIFFSNISYANSNINLTEEEIQYIKNNPTIKVGAEKNWAPFDFAEEGTYKGLARDYLDIIEKKTSLKFEYDIDSWNNLLKKIKQNKIQLLPILKKTQKREEYLLFTRDYLTIRAYVYALKDAEISNAKDLVGKTIAIPKGSSHEEYIEKNHPKVKVLTVKNVLEAIDAINTKKADFLISNIPIINYLTNKQNLSKIYPKFHLNDIENKLSMATNKQTNILVNIIQKALDSITQNEKNTISSKWLGNIENKKVLTFTKEEINFIKKNEKLVIANELAYKPYDFNEEGEPKGYIIDYIRLLFSKIGIEPIFKAKEWSLLVNDFKERKIDILPIITKNKKREEYISFSKPYINQNMSIITKKSNNSLINIDDLDGKTVALAKNWNMTKFVKKHHPKIKVIEYKTVSEFLDAVANNYADATILDKLSANYYIKSKYTHKLHITGTAHIKNFNPILSMGVHRDTKILKDIINKAMLLISDEEQKNLNNKWINHTKNINFTKKELDFIKNTIINISLVKTWAPFAFENNGKPYGLGYDFWSLIIDKANLKTKNHFDDKFSSSLKKIELKENDVLVTTSKTKDREKFAIFSDSYFKAPIGIATLKDKDYIPDASKLIGKKVAVGENYTAHKLIKEAYPSINLIPVKNISEALDLLSKDEVYAVVDIMPVLIHNIKSKGFNNIKITGVTGIDFNMNILIRNDYTLLQSIINKVLKNITPEEKELIYNKWLNIEYEKVFDYSLFWKVALIFIIILLLILYKNNQLLKYQKRLENTTKNFETVIDLSLAGILIIKDYQIIYANKETLNIFKYEELVNKDISMLLQEKDIVEIIRQTEEKDKEHEVIGITKDRTNVPLLVNAKKIVYDNLSSYIISVVDLTEIKNKENLIIQQSKMASLGEMIANIAHQWRQPLSSITTTASGLKVQKEFGLLTDKIFIDSVDSITNTTQFLSQTIDDFQNYMRKDKIKQNFTIENSINTVLSIVKGSLKNYFINIEKDIEEIELYSYENELNQAILNIINNSKDALKNIEENQRNIYINVLKKDNKALIEIIDTAGGIKEDIIKKVFEPYFTTKHKSQGTGLGLYMTHKIITESLEGQISINNISYKNYEKCTKVNILIPIKL